MSEQIQPGKKIGIVGAARQGIALARFCVAHGIKVVMNDQRPEEQLTEAMRSLADLPIEWIVGGHPFHVLDGLDLLCLSGGVPLDIPLVKEAIGRGIPLSNDSQIFMQFVPCPVIGITGSAGKTTTTTLVGKMADAYQNLTKKFRKVFVGGNIGNPLILEVDEMMPSDLVIMELSSFQLELMTCSPHIAAILNVTPNHLDRHKTMEAYMAAKVNIIRFQNNFDKAILNRDEQNSWSYRHQLKSELVSFGFSEVPKGTVGTYLEGNYLCLYNGRTTERLFSRERILLRGEHNLGNVLAACAIANAAGFSKASMQAGVEGFQGVEHRLQFIRTWGGAEWYNDSIATAPERTIAAINSFTEPIILLAGGRDKNLPWDQLVALIHQRVDHLILFGEAANMIAKKVEIVPKSQNDRLESIDLCKGLQQAVEKAAQLVNWGDVVLFSPGCTSFDEFRDFEERGEFFTKWVTELP